MAHGVVPVPAEIAPKYTTGRYAGASRDDQAGFYWVNTYALNRRPLYEMPALTLHEAVPGHHLQISLAREQASLPDYRRSFYTSAFGEGWGLYAEYLGWGWARLYPKDSREDSNPDSLQKRGRKSPSPEGVP